MQEFCKKGVLRNLAKFTGKHLCQSLFFNKVGDFRPATLLKKRLWPKCFPVNTFFTEHLWATVSIISRLKIKLRHTCDKYSQIEAPYKYRNEQLTQE